MLLDTTGAAGIAGIGLTVTLTERLLPQHPLELLPLRYTVLELLTLYVDEALVVLVPVELVCQYQVTPLGGVALVSVLLPQLFDEILGDVGIDGIGFTETETERLLPQHPDELLPLK